MALHPDFPESPHAIIDPSVRWLPDQSLLFDLDYGMLLPPLVQKIREQVKTWRDNNYRGASADKQSTPQLVVQYTHTCENRLTEQR